MTPLTFINHDADIVLGTLLAVALLAFILAWIPRRP